MYMTMRRNKSDHSKHLTLRGCAKFQIIGLRLPHNARSVELDDLYHLASYSSHKQVASEVWKPLDHLIRTGLIELMNDSMSLN